MGSAEQFRLASQASHMTLLPAPLGAWRTVVLVSLLLVTCTVLQTDAMAHKGQLKSDSYVFFLSSFGFQSGGVAKVELITPVEKEDYAIIGCNSKESLNLESNSLTELCGLINETSSPCRVTFFTRTGNKNRDFLLSNAEVLTFYLLNCGRGKTNVEYSLETKNRDGNHLSTVYLHMPTEIVLIMVATLALGVQVAVSRLMNLREKSLLHLLICCYPILKLISCVVALLYWQQMKRFGLVSTALTAFYNFSFVAEQIFALAVIALAAHGFGIAIPSIDYERVLVLIVGVMGAFAIVLASFASNWFKIFALLSWFTVLALSIRSVSYHHKRLRLAVTRVEEPDRVLEELIDTFRAFKFGMLLFGLVLLSLLLLDVLALANHQWLLQLLLDFTLVGFYAFFAYIFRLRPGFAYYKQHASVAGLNVHIFENAASTSLLDEMEMEKLADDEKDSAASSEKDADEENGLDGEDRGMTADLDLWNATRSLSHHRNASMDPADDE